MDKNNVTVHMVVKNEDRFIWYAISSVLPFAERLLIYDTGSQDQTVKIIQSFKDERIEFDIKTVKSATDITRLRQEQSDKTKNAWIWVVDGDEIYPFSTCKEIREIIKKDGDRLEGIVVGRYDLIGDIYHYQREDVGTYSLFGRQGHMALRLINKKNISQLKVHGDYPMEGYYDDKSQTALIDHDQSKFKFTKGKLFHAMYLKRSTLGANLKDTYHRNKLKLESGIAIPIDMERAEVFDFVRPHYVENVTTERSKYYQLLAFFVTPIKTVKRLLWRLFQ